MGPRNGSGISEVVLWSGRASGMGVSEVWMVRYKLYGNNVAGIDMYVFGVLVVFPALLGNRSRFGTDAQPFEI
jgi:hypothetical protein